MEILRLDIPDRLSLFKLPPTSNSKGYYFGDWKEQVWEGGLKLFEVNDKMVIKFFKDGKVDIQLAVPENYEEAIIKCEDSVRGFAIRLNNPNGGFKWMGLGFRDRNSAFDFRSRIIDFYERKEDDATIGKVDITKAEDFSMKKGEKIQMAIGGIKTSGSSSTTTQPSNTNFKFEMPPSSQSSNTQNTFGNNNNNNNSWDNWNFGSSNNNNGSNNNNNNNSNNKNDFFGDFSDFSNFGNQQQNQQQQQQQQQQWGFGNNNNFSQQQQGNNSSNAQQWGFGGNTNNYQQPQQQQYQQPQQQQQFYQQQQGFNNNNQYNQQQNNFQQNNSQQNSNTQQPSNTIDLLDL